MEYHFVTILLVERPNRMPGIQPKKGILTIAYDMLNNRISKAP